MKIKYIYKILLIFCLLSSPFKTYATLTKKDKNKASIFSSKQHKNLEVEYDINNEDNISQSSNQDNNIVPVQKIEITEVVIKDLEIEQEMNKNIIEQFLLPKEKAKFFNITQNLIECNNQDCETEEKNSNSNIKNPAPIDEELNESSIEYKNSCANLFDLHFSTQNKKIENPFQYDFKEKLKKSKEELKMLKTQLSEHL